MTDLVEPDDGESRRDALEQDLLLQLVPPREASLIADWACRNAERRWWPNGASMNPLTEEVRLESLVRTCGRAFRSADSTQATVTGLLRDLVLRGVVLDQTGSLVRAESELPPSLQEGVAALTVVLPLLKDLGLDVRKAVAKIDSEASLQTILCASPDLHTELCPADLLDLKALRAWNPIAQRSSAHVKGPSHVGFWFQVRGAAAIPQLFDVGRAEAPDAAGRVAGAILQEIAHPIGRHPGSDLLREPASRAALETFCHHLLELSEESDCREPFLLAAAFEAAALLEQTSKDPLDREIDARAGKLAARVLGLLRREARDGLPDQPLPEAHRARTAYGSALVALARAEGLGAMLCSSVQLLRALREPCVPADLRWWPEEGLEAPPLAWGWLPMAMAALIHSRGRMEQATDEDLRQARTALSSHLVQRLKPRKRARGPEDLTEPHPIWRQCCIRAVQELGVNPEGRGHRVLYNAEQQDPDPDVRRLAHAARHTVRRADAEPDDLSPRRRLMAALWWLRQAHRLELGLDVDPFGSRRTRQREISGLVREEKIRELGLDPTPQPHKKQQGGTDTPAADAAQNTP